MLGLGLMTLLYFGIAIYAICHYRDNEADLKELFFIIGTLLVIGFALIYRVLNI